MCTFLLSVVAYLWVFADVCTLSYDVDYISRLIDGIASGDRNCKINKKRILIAHDDYRHLHSAPKLQWSKELEESAMEEAKRISNEDSCRLTSYYRNLTATNYLSVRKQAFEELAAIEFWYEGNTDYDFGKCAVKSRNPNALSFTQLIWKNTTHVGCGVSCCDRNIVLVCRYHPFGNIPGKFCSNVGQRYYDEIVKESQSTSTKIPTASTA